MNDSLSKEDQVLAENLLPSARLFFFLREARIDFNMRIHGKCSWKFMENIVQLQLVAKVTKKTEDKGPKNIIPFPFSDLTSSTSTPA